MIWPILEARAEIQKYFRSFFGSNEDIQKSFWNYLTFSRSNQGVKLLSFSTKNEGLDFRATQNGLCLLVERNHTAIMS